MQVHCVRLPMVLLALASCGDDTSSSGGSGTGASSSTQGGAGVAGSGGAGGGLASSSISGGSGGDGCGHGKGSVQTAISMREVALRRGAGGLAMGRVSSVPVAAVEGRLALSWVMPCCCWRP